MQQWEVMRIGSSTNDAGLAETINDLGMYGWELVAITSVDKTVGLNAVVAMLKRAIKPLAPPTELVEGWKDDPSNQADVRWWDGAFWTHHVGWRDGSARRTGRLPPTSAPKYRPPDFTR